MKIEVPTKTIKFGNLGVCGGDVFDYDGNHMMKIKNNIDTGRSIDTDRFYNAVRLTDGTLYIISADALIKPLPNAKLVIE
jgi:hypothetical protein